jgi:hypothetical protein
MWRVRFQGPACGALLLCLARVGLAHTYTPDNHFQTLPVSNLGSVQAKLTYVGGLQDAPIATAAFALPQNPTHVALFAAFRHPGFDYGNDDEATNRFSVSADELKRLIDSVATISAVTRGPSDTTGLISFALMDTAGETTRVFDAVPSVPVARTMFAKLLGALQTNVDAVRAIRDLGCTTEALPLTPPSALDSRASVKFSGLRPVRSVEGRYVGQLRLTNGSPTAIDAPIVVVVRMRGNATLRTRTGRTCRITPPGRPYVVLAAVEPLAAGKTIERRLTFDNPTRNRPSIDFRVYGGPGMP